MGTVLLAFTYNPVLDFSDHHRKSMMVIDDGCNVKD